MRLYSGCDMEHLIIVQYSLHMGLTDLMEVSVFRRMIRNMGLNRIAMEMRELSVRGGLRLRVTRGMQMALTSRDLYSSILLMWKVLPRDHVYRNP